MTWKLEGCFLMQLTRSPQPALIRPAEPSVHSEITFVVLLYNTPIFQTQLNIIAMAWQFSGHAQVSITLRAQLGRQSRLSSIRLLSNAGAECMQRAPMR